MADGKRLIGHAGAVLLRRRADRTGLTDALARVLPSSTVVGWRCRAAVLVQLAVAIVLGAENLSEAEQLQLHHRPLFGFAASDTTAPPCRPWLDCPLPAPTRQGKEYDRTTSREPWNPGAAAATRECPVRRGTNRVNQQPGQTITVADESRLEGYSTDLVACL
ncbi:hypothetical protein [Streptomyces sp. NPDC088178]|uniref:hypothetical protein n=1 Tax=Streptomyces sp. NPDC088178 TaxID=3365836 RepID=UPI003813C7CF